MANHCSNYIEINTSVNPLLFLSNPIDPETMRPDLSKITFELQESICPFEDPTDRFTPKWWTKWFEAHDVEVSPPQTTKAPPAPEPIIITQWARRYPVKQKPDFVPRTSRNITIWGDSAWAPPLWYLEALYELLKKTDDQVSITCWFYEPGCCFSGHWHNGVESYDDFPDRYYSNLLDKDVYLNLSQIPDTWKHFTDIDEALSKEDAITQLSILWTPEADEEILEIQNHLVN